MAEASQRDILTLSELWRAAYRAGYRDADLHRGFHDDESIPDRLPIDLLPYPLDADDVR